ncbi:MAG: hypothetical protein IKC91_04620 [Clostridia bacterium]|nr:hypothetical protein [Clostridia bacterium]
MQYIRYGYVPTPTPAPPPKTPADTFKRLLSSGWFLFVLICTFAILILQVVQAFLLSDVFTKIFEAIKETGALTSAEKVAMKASAKLLDKYFFSIALAALTPYIFTFIGYLWLYIGAKNGKDKTVARGATVFQVFNMISVVVLALYLVLFICLMLLCVVEFLSTKDSLYIVEGIVLLLFFFVIVLVLKFYSNFANMWKGLKQTVLTGKNCCKVSSYVVFWCWVGIVLSIVGAVASLAMSILTAIIAALNVVCNIIVIGVFTNFKDEEGEPQK